jgi:hypothetical protein
LVFFELLLEVVDKDGKQLARQVVGAMTEMD